MDRIQSTLNTVFIDQKEAYQAEHASQLKEVMLMTKELRMTATPMQIRDGDEKHPTVIEGYALKFDRKSEIMGGGEFGFREHIDRHALDNADMSNVVALFNHDQNQVLGRTGVNLELTIDDNGLKVHSDATRYTTRS